MRDPFHIASTPAVVSFSGGRTSGYMLRHILDAHDGALPNDTHVLFTNTGKERPETLDFVRDCGSHWNVPITWLEWRDGENGQRFTEVSHNSASRAGEPFAALIQKRKFLPNAVARFCTQELKVRVMRDWMRAQGHDHWANYVGFRADEAHRLTRATQSCARERWTVEAPMVGAGIEKRNVMRFWSEQPFDLRLQQHEGNCDLCFLKNREKLRSIMYDRPDLAEWWIEQERQSGGTFRPPARPTYQQLLDTRQDQIYAFDMDALDLDCACTD